MRPTANSRQIDRSTKTGIDQRAHHESWVGHAEFGKEAESQAGLNHPLDPIVARRAEHLPKDHAAAVQLLAHWLEDLAIGPVDVGLLVKLRRRDFVERDESVVGRQHDHEPFFEDWQLVERFRELSGDSNHRYLEFSLLQHVDHPGPASIHDLHFDVGVLRAELHEQLGNELRAYGAHRADRQSGPLEFLYRSSLVARGAAALLDRLQIGEHHPPQLGQMGIAPFTVEERAAQLVLELLDCAGESRLAHVALLGRAREVQRAGKSDEISNLLHFHKQSLEPSTAKRHYTLGTNWATAVMRVPHKTHALSVCDASGFFYENVFGCRTSKLAGP